MKRPGLAFFLTFVATVLAIAFALQFDRTMEAVIIGIGGLFLQWLTSRRSRFKGEELADASYFFGFLLTLSFLTIGLYKLGGAARGQAMTNAMLGFLEELAAGLVLTVVGLLLRQVSILSPAAIRAGSEVPSDQSDVLVKKLDRLVEVWTSRPEHLILDRLQESQTLTRETAGKLQTGVNAAIASISTALKQLEEATTKATESMERSASRVAGELESATQEIGKAVTSIRLSFAAQTDELTNEARRVAAAANKMTADRATEFDNHVTTWKEALERARKTLGKAHEDFEEAYRRGLGSFSDAGGTFQALAEEAASQVASLPDPSERLSRLWEGVRQLEASLTKAISGSTTEFNALTERTHRLREGLTLVGTAAGGLATALRSGGDDLTRELRREIEQMTRLLEEYVALVSRMMRAAR